jgi:hypothetical protein
VETIECQTACTASYSSAAVSVPLSPIYDAAGGLLQVGIVALLNRVVLSVGDHGTRPTAGGAGRAFESGGENFMDLTEASDDRVGRRREETCEGSGQ